MVDISGLTHKQVQIVPQHSKMEALGITTRDIENALANSNVEPGSMTVREGYYEYNIRFSTVVRTVEDIENIPSVTMAASCSWASWPTCVSYPPPKQDSPNTTASAV